MPKPCRLLVSALSWAALVVVLAPACKRRATAPAAENAPTAAPAAPVDRRLVVKVLYGGPKDDGGFNQAQAQGAAALTRLPGVRLVEQQSVADDRAEAALDQAAAEGARLVFVTAFAHFDPPVIAAAQRHPDTTFVHCGSFYQEGKHPPNAASYHAYLDEAFYVAGVTAGLTSKTRKLGFVAAKGLPHVLRDINAFTLGARAVNPRITTAVVFTNAWSAPAQEAAAATRLIDGGVDVLAMYVDAPGTLLELAEKRGIFSVGVHTDGAKLAPRGYLTGAEWRWGKLYADYGRWVRDGQRFPRLLRGGLREGYVEVSPFGPAVVQKTKERAALARAQLVEGKLVIFKGPLKDNAGKQIFPPGQELIRNDIQLELASFLVEGVVGALPD